MSECWLSSRIPKLVGTKITSIQNMTNLNTTEDRNLISQTLVSSIKKTILEPYTYLTSIIRTSNIQTKLIHCFNSWYQIPGDKLDIICTIGDTLYNANLLINDLTDGKNLRGGVATTHEVYGTPLSINSASYVFSEVLQIVRELRTKMAPKIMIEQMLVYHEAEGMEKYWRDWDLENYPTEKEFEDTVTKKESSFTLLMVNLLQDCCESRGDVGRREIPDFSKLIKLIGYHNQLKEDHSAFCSALKDADTKDEGGLEKFIDGKMIYPIVHMINKKDGSGDRILEILRVRTRAESLTKEALGLLKVSGALGRTHEKLIEIQGQIFDEIENIEKLGGNGDLRQLFEEESSLAIN